MEARITPASQTQTALGSALAEAQSAWDAGLDSHSPDYHRAIAATLQAWSKQDPALEPITVRLPSGDRVRLTHATNSPFPKYDRLIVASTVEQKGLRTEFKRDGFGVPIVMTRENPGRTALERHQPPEGIFHPGNAWFEFDRDGRTARLHLVNVCETDTATVAGRHRELAYDLTLPWALLLANVDDLHEAAWTGMLQPDAAPREPRLYLMEPYQPDKIPLVMVHGLQSSPLAWMQLTNELRGDPVIRQQYQIWHFYYPTGTPISHNAWLFRREMEEVRRLVDPGLDDFATNHMVVLGHSMGGLVTRMAVTDSGTTLWDAFFQTPPPTTAADPEAAYLRELFLLEPKPWIDRVIFVAVPHRGSGLADNPVARLLAKDVQLPGQFERLHERWIDGMALDLTPAGERILRQGVPGSITGLSLKNPLLIALDETRPVVPYHSIIGDRGRGGGHWSTDGVVPYRSATLSGAESELVVPGDHGAYETNEAVQEIRRILREHLGD